MAFKFKAKYGNYIGGKFVDPVDGKYFDNITPVNGKVLCQIPRSNEKDINLALDAAHAAKDAWGATSVTERSQILHNIAQVMADNFATLAEAETWDNGKPIRETTNADLPLAPASTICVTPVLRKSIRRNSSGSLASLMTRLPTLDNLSIAYGWYLPFNGLGCGAT